MKLSVLEDILSTINLLLNLFAYESIAKEALSPEICGNVVDQYGMLNVDYYQSFV